MKKILIPFFLLLVTAAHAQLNNSWIDYSKTYYKFKLAKTGLCRIPQSVLATAGLGTAPAEQFQLWRNGEQVRIYTSVANGAFSSGDYIEFWGKQNDGVPDKPLYLKPNFGEPDYQLCDSFSLCTDTASYFLTVSPAGGNLHYATSPNNVAANVLPADAYFMRRIEAPYNHQYNRGYAAIVGEYVYSASYDKGEGWTSDNAVPAFPLFKQLDGLNVYTSGPQNNVSFYISAFGNALNTRNLVVKFFNTPVVTEPMNYFSIVKKRLDNLPLSLLQSPDYLQVSMNGDSNNPNDRIVVGVLTLTYPAKFNFNNTKNFYFELRSSQAGNFLVIDNFNTGSAVPALYDINNGKRYAGDLSTAGKVKFALPGSTDSLRKFMLVNEEASNVTTISNLTPRTFTDFNNTDNQSDYIIISNPVLYDDGHGVDYVKKYRDYRASIEGGSYNAKIIDIGELDDQFAFGIKKHPAAIRDFIRFASKQFSIKPKYVFIIGRGMSTLDHQENQADPVSDKIDLVQTFGWPASDVLLACEPNRWVPLVPIGRLSVINGTEISQYLNKMREYETSQASPSDKIDDKAWMKNMVHVVGGADSAENALFLSYMNSYKKIAEDTLLGGNVETFQKSSTSAVEQASGARIEELINSGLGFVGYFGHSSANTLAFNLSSPETYQNSGKYPFFNISGCSAGNIFIYDPARLTGTLSLSEKYVLANERGSIGFLASTHLGIPPFLNYFNTELYHEISHKMYGNTIGNQLKQVDQTLGGNSDGLDFYTRMHLEEITLNGDPALKVNAFALPDYAIEDKLVKISPSVISVADNVTANIQMRNIGRAINDSIRVTVYQVLPDNVSPGRELFNKKIRGIQNIDSINLALQINPATDIGLNKLVIKLDADNQVDESSENNNTITKEFYIFEDEIRPVYPYNYSIINQQNITYSASTANPINGQREYVMQVDTTELFNSPFVKEYKSNGPGGLIQFTPNNITFTDSTVYYWRTSMTPINNSPVIWNTFSFIYLPTGGTGFNQSHYYQHLKSKYSESIKLDADRVFKYTDVKRNLIIKTGLYPATPYDRISVFVDFQQLDIYGCYYGTLQFYVYDSTTLTPWANFNVENPVTHEITGRFKSWPVCADGPRTSRNFFEFRYDSAIYRKRAMDFIDSIPNGMYVSITNLGYDVNTSFIQQWKNDQATLGTGKSLYHKLQSIGFTKIDSFTKNLPFIYLYRKNDSRYTPQQVMGASQDEQLDITFPLTTRENSGTIESPPYGPAKAWKFLHWRGKSIDPVLKDSVKILVYGIKKDGTEELKATVMPAIDSNISFIDAKIYPYVKLKMLNSDRIYSTPNQLRYWRVNADYVPEGAVAPNILFTMRDTVEQGEKIEFALAFKNVSPVAFDSLKVNFFITSGTDNFPHPIPVARMKALVSGDTLVVRYTIDTRNYPGINTLYVMVNPDNDQPEQYLYNNFVYKDFYVKPDKYNPLLDITFDGVHILNRDIVTPRPHILVKLKDESRFLALADTALLKVQVRFPAKDGESEGELHNYFFGDSMLFTPANLAGGDNTASIDFNPTFPSDGEYELIITGKDVAGNKAGKLEYRVTFTIINKPMISNLMNYPNPFTTSTAFVFTLTGSEIPQNMRIQILTITGKVVREITQAELGPIHIGRNITEFKWDGTDMYGQKLANGVYLYRVLTNLNGQKMDKYKADGDDTDKYFTKGYGKMYLMR